MFEVNQALSRSDANDNDRNKEPKPHSPDKPAPKPVREPGRSAPEVEDPKRRVPKRAEYASRNE